MRARRTRRSKKRSSGNGELSETMDITVRLFKYLMYEEVQWDEVLRQSTVQCKKCIELMKAQVLEDNVNFNQKLLEEAALGLTLEDEVIWAVKFGEEVAEMANNPNWFCFHESRPNESHSKLSQTNASQSNESTYFVDAIRAGVKQLMESYS